MDHGTRVSGGSELARLRYKLVPGSTTRYDLRLDLALTIGAGPDRDPETLNAQINAELDLEIVRINDDETAIVRVTAKDVGMWVKSDSTLDEDAVSDPLSGLPVAFLLDPLGSTVPMADTMGREVAPPDDTNAVPFVLKAMLPQYAERAVGPGDSWEVRPEHGTLGDLDPGKVQCSYERVQVDDRGRAEPVIHHQYRYEWRQDDHTGTTAYAARTQVAVRDGWPRTLTGEVRIEQRYGETVVTLQARRAD